MAKQTQQEWALSVKGMSWEALAPDERAEYEAKHYAYGSGLPGCMFDNGPNYAGTDKESAIDCALFIFADDLSEDEYEQAHNDLVECGLHYFPSDRRSELGAGVVQVWECDPQEFAEDIED